MFSTTCTYCGVSLEVPPHYHGREIKCASCRMSFTALPPEERQFEYPCQICNGGILVTWSMAGNPAKCPHCNVTMDIPQPQLLQMPTVPKDPEANCAKGQQNAPGIIYSMTGVQDQLEVYSDRIAITPKGVLGFLNKGLKGTKTIPFTSITAMQFKKADVLTSGFLQFTVLGGNESRGGILAATKDENSFFFRSDNESALRIKDYVEKRVQEMRHAHSATPSSIADEIQKLGALKAQGLLTDSEFIAAKNRLLS
jgi:Short C-terminal domain